MQTSQKRDSASKTGDRLFETCSKHNIKKNPQNKIQVKMWLKYF
jgi:hypothetical protein